MAEKTLSNNLIILKEIYDLGGSYKYIHIDDFAIKCWEDFPKRFSMKRYPQYPDTKTVFFSLEPLMKEERGKLVKGNGKGGYILTTNGIEWIKNNVHIIKRLFKGKIGKQRKLPTDSIYRIIDDIEHHEIFQRYLHDHNSIDIKEFEFADFLRCGLDTNPKIKKQKLDKYLNLAKELNRKELYTFLKFCEKKFEYIIN